MPVLFSNVGATGVAIAAAAIAATGYAPSLATNLTVEPGTGSVAVVSYVPDAGTVSSQPFGPMTMRRDPDRPHRGGGDGDRQGGHGMERSCAHVRSISDRERPGRSGIGRSNASPRPLREDSIHDGFRKTLASQ